VKSNDFYAQSRVEARLKHLQNEQLLIQEGRKQ
jgi:hypothetical protein